MDAPIKLDDLNSLIDDLETQIDEIRLPQAATATVTGTETFVTTTTR